jgi:bifunctional DNase/RNase
MAQLLQAAGGQVREVRMELLAERAVGARILIESQAGAREVDARASDAVNLALVLEAPIRLSASMLHDDDEDSASDRQALNQIYAEDTEGSAAIAAERAERISQGRHSFNS